PKEAWWLAFVVLVNRSGMMVVFFMTLYLTRELGFSVLQAGQIMSIWGIGSLLGSYSGGWLSDRIGTYHVQLYSLIWNGIGFILLGQMRAFESIGITIFLVAVVGEAFRPANITAFTEICPPDIRARGIVLNRLSSNLGIAVGPAIGGFLARINYGFIFWVDGLTCLMAASVFYLLFHSRRSFRVEHVKEIHETGRSPWTDPVFMIVMALLLMQGLVFYQLFNTWPLYMREVNQFFENQIGFLLTVNCILLVIFEMPLIHRLEKVNPLSSIKVGVIFIFNGFLLLPFNGSYAYSVLTVVLWTIGEMLVFPLAATFIANRAQESNRGRYMGGFTLVFSICFILSPIIGSFAYTTIGPRTMWLSTGFVGMFVWTGFFFLNRFLNKSSNTIVRQSA
ncbi:MFS transporter, partial [candidate division KSB1 bacterium]|nr:MFS transporter [candidate division KSB1 bacterium]